jgi:large subunit ribosomal protein L2
LTQAKNKIESMKLKTIKKKQSGRNSSGKVVVRHQGGQHKRFIRNVDFKRDKRDIEGRVVSIEYDPNRTADVALVQYADGEKKYILAPNGLKQADIIMAGEKVSIKIGNALPLGSLPIGTVVHNVEINPGRGGQIARGAGTSAILQAKEGEFAHLKMPSGEIRKVRVICFATVGELSNLEWKNHFFAKAGNKRNRGIRPTVRGTAQNPRSHPHGGGEGRSGVGMKSPKTVYGRIAVGNTRRPKKYSNKYILSGRTK